MSRFLQIGLLLFIIGAFWLFAVQEIKPKDLPKKSNPVESNLESLVKSTFSPSPYLDFDFRWRTIPVQQGKQLFKGFSTKYCLDEENILCFRGNHYRNAPTRGKLDKTPVRVQLDWIFRTRRDTSNTRFGRWGGGTGWTGQPLVVKWNRKMKEKLGITNPAFKTNENALEIIIGSLSGDVYFLDFETGDSTRKSFQVDGPIKGTPSLDPRLNGLLYVGQGIDVGRRFGSYIIDMTKERIVLHQSGKDEEADRKWGAFDSNPLVDRQSGTVFWPSENGIIYTFNAQNKEKVQVAQKWNYSNNSMIRRGLEASMAANGQFGFFADNSGNIFCMDLIHQIPIWNQKNEDDTDASLVLDPDSLNYLYVGNEVDFRAPEAISSFRKLNAKNGKEIWRVERLCRGTPIANKTNSGGILATPLIGKEKCKNLVYVIFSRMNEKNQSELVAVDKNSGKEVFSFLMKAYSWASPIDLYDKDGNMFIFLTDVRGNIYLINGKTGKLIFTEKTNYTFESSPIAIDNRIVVGVRGNKILSFLVK